MDHCRPAREPLDTVLDVRDLTVKLPAGADREFAVEGVSFHIKQREILCVVGESGSGKSISSYAIMGLLPQEAVPVRGQVMLEGEDLLQATDDRRRNLRGSRMAMIFQEPMTALNPVMTVGHQIEEVLYTHTDMTPVERRKRVLQVIKDVNLPDPQVMCGLYPHQLSGGQRQRAMIAAALALEPRLLIADEPTTALDVTTQAQILSILKEIQSSHDMAVLFVTHDIGVVAEVADRVVVMKTGKVVEHGTVDEVLLKPRHDYTKSLIASVPGLSPLESRVVQDKPVVLAIDRLTKVYDTQSFFGQQRIVKAVDDVTLSVRAGSILGIIGESGSGKTTLARCVMRLVEPTGGTIVVDGFDLAHASRRELRSNRQKIQMVFQDPYRSLSPRQRVGASIIEGPMNFGVPKSEAMERASRLLNLVGLDSSAVSRYPHQFSGGQRQRICIARALAMEPKILVADEIVSALDVTVQAQVLDLLNQIREKFDLAVLFITHDLRVAGHICDETAVMQNGQLVEFGPTSDVLANAQHTYTRQLLAAAPGRGFEWGETSQPSGCDAT